MRNRALYEAMRGCCEAAITKLAERYRDLHALPATYLKQVKVGRTGSCTWSRVETVDWIEVVDSNAQLLKSLKEYAEATEAMRSDAKFSRHLSKLVGTSESKGRIDEDIVLRHILIALFQEQNALTFKESVFARLYAITEDYFYSDQLEYMAFAPLPGFKTDVEVIPLEETMSITQVSNEKMEEWLATPVFAMTADTQELLASRYVLTLRMRVAKLLGDENSETSLPPGPTGIAREKFSHVLSALRLFKKGHVGFRDIFLEGPTGDLFGGRSSVHLTAVRNLTFADYSLVGSEVAKFVRFWKAYQDARQAIQSPIERALRRLEASYNRWTSEDRLLDFVIAFEVLFRTTNKHTAAFRAAALIGGNLEDLKRTYTIVKAAYGIRHSIVHEGAANEMPKLGEERITLSALVDKTEEILRKAIRVALQQPYSINQLDEAILRGLESGGKW